MDIGMTISAVLADIGEDRLHVTLRASEFFVPPSKRETRLIVVELRVFADRIPASGRMAVLAGNL